jgi:excinuclease UvrABC nuclease subunit
MGMDFLEYIDVEKLPSIAMSAKHEFPEVACVYLVFDIEHTIHYVGGTTNLRNRWINHQKYEVCCQLQIPRIAYMKVSPQMVWELEAFLIRYLRPQFNILIPDESSLINYQTL